MKWVKLNWRHQINQQNGRLRGPCSVCCYILDFFLCFRFLSLHSRLRQSLFLLMRTTQISKAVSSNMMSISRRLQSVLHRRRIVLEAGYIRETSDGLGKSIGILPCMTFWESIFEWASTLFTPFVVFCRHSWQKETLASVQRWSDCW